LSKNRNFGGKSKFCPKIEILVTNRNFGQKSKFWQKAKFWSKIKILAKNRNFGQKWKFLQRIIKNETFTFSIFGQNLNLSFFAKKIHVCCCK